jgi:hypothetical protein
LLSGAQRLQFGPEHHHLAPVNDDGSVTGLLARLERYYDTVPRRFAPAEDHGPFTLFLGEPDGWVYYARPPRVL